MNDNNNLPSQGMTASQPSLKKHDGRPDRQSLDRLLRSASQQQDDTSVTPPFGFETRVVALWRAGLPNGNNGLARLLQRVAMLAASIIVVASAAMIFEIKQTRTRLSEPLTNEFAMADSAIQDEISP